MKMTDLKAGDVVIPDNGFGCLEEGQQCEVGSEAGCLFVYCDLGKHYLDGQIDKDGNIVGLTSA